MGLLTAASECFIEDLLIHYSLRTFASKASKVARLVVPSVYERD